MECGWSQSSAELPLQVGGIDAGASWRAARIAEANDAHQWALLLFGRSDKLLIDAIQHQLGPTEHPEVLVVIHGAPSQVEEAIASLAVNRRASEVHRRITSCDDSNIELPPRGPRVASDEIVWVVPDLNPDADVVQRTAVRITERPSREIEAVDDKPHTSVSHRPAAVPTAVGVHGFAHAEVNGTRTTPVRSGAWIVLGNDGFVGSDVAEA